MSQITISNEMYTRLTEFKQIVEIVMNEKTTFDTYIELILEQGINSMLAELLGSTDSTILLKSLQQLGSQYPAQIYQYIAEMLRQGGAAREQEGIRQRLGFHPEETTQK